MNRDLSPHDAEPAWSGDSFLSANMDALDLRSTCPAIRKTYHPILPFCFFTLRVNPKAFKAFILRKKGVIPLPQSLGEHLRNRRLVLDLRQE
ncbi:MAG: hypothetical protein NTY98_05625, partial [Verrucomicrobia bacterium]|nr:hypothetical protein [Verrucomicrobiota bacterium]